MLKRNNLLIGKLEFVSLSLRISASKGSGFGSRNRELLEG